MIVHEKIACDLPLTDISEEHRDAVRLFGTKSLPLLWKIEILAQDSDDYGSLAVVFYPHSGKVVGYLSLAQSPPLPFFIIHH